MHTKTFITTLLASQLAFAAVIPFTERAQNGGLNPISSLAAPSVEELHAREAEAAEGRPNRLPTAGGINPINGMPAPGHPIYDQHRKGRKNGNGKRPHSNGQAKRPNRPRPDAQRRPNRLPTAGGINPINGMPAPGSPVYDQHRHKNGNGNGNGNRPHRGNGQNRPNRPRPNGQGNRDQDRPNRQRPNQARPNRPRPNNGENKPNRARPNGQGDHRKPQGIVINPIKTPKPQGIVINPVQPPKPQGIVITPVSHPAPRNTEKPKDLSQGMIGNKPSRRDVENDEEEVYDEKSEQLSEFDMGIAETEDLIEEDEFSEILRREVEAEAEAEVEEDEDSELLDQEFESEDDYDDEEYSIPDEDENTETQLFERDEKIDEDFLRAHEADRLFWEEQMMAEETADLE